MRKPLFSWHDVHPHCWSGGKLVPRTYEPVRQVSCTLAHKSQESSYPSRNRAAARPRGGQTCLLYTSDAADDLLCVDLGGRRIIKKKKKEKLSHDWLLKNKRQCTRMN
eukprot:TRINITY_DN5080_c0_g1_i2.p2 TRINITY_DN5080_c0_g1~~TRINITY_DN5080_c0_g1_i2.p2  ORF type:complete len:108 (+),score=14.34 TRINITY_DN5080_c0_g1_i2:452-775(+)